MLLLLPLLSLSRCFSPPPLMSCLIFLRFRHFHFHDILFSSPMSFPLIFSCADFMRSPFSFTALSFALASLLLPDFRHRWLLLRHDDALRCRRRRFSFADADIALIFSAAVDIFIAGFHFAALIAANADAVRYAAARYRLRGACCAMRAFLRCAAPPCSAATPG